MNVRLLAPVLLLCSASVCGAGTPSTVKDFSPRYQEIVRSAGSIPDSVRLHQLFDLDWEYDMYTFPEWATWVGYPGGNDRWTDNSPDAIRSRNADLDLRLTAIASIDRDALEPEDRLSYDLFKRDIERSIEGEKFHGEYMPISQLGGVQQEAPNLLAMMPRASVTDYEDILSRLRGLPVVVDQTIALMRTGLEQGMTPPQITLRDVPDQVASLLTSDSPLESPLLLPFREFPASIPAADRERLRDSAIAIYRDRIVSSLAGLEGFLRETYIPGARTSIGMSALPNGKEWYAYNVRGQTTTDLTPGQIHRIGLDEVKRIRGEMEKVIASTGFKGTFSEFLEFLRTDPQFFYTDAQSLLQGYRDICKRADPELIRLFGHLPRLPYGVIPVPSYSEKSQTTAYYNPGSPQAGRPGYFYANTYDLAARPKWEMEALALHESVPGHHLQIAIAQELENVPEFRRDAGYTAFVEGWGLYAESLGYDMGFYKDPYSRFGQLTYEMWRAVRLVVDVGIHDMGWTRQQAIDYFKENTGKSEHDITVEVDRYIVWPGQALAYKIGQLKIRELRSYAERELGSGFDVRAFHDCVLGAGALPLDVLERRVHVWVASVKPPEIQPIGVAPAPMQPAR